MDAIQAAFKIVVLGEGKFSLLINLTSFVVNKQPELVKHQ